MFKGALLYPMQQQRPCWKSQLELQYAIISLPHLHMTITPFIYYGVADSRTNKGNGRLYQQAVKQNILVAHVYRYL